MKKLSLIALLVLVCFGFGQAQLLKPTPTWERTPQGQLRTIDFSIAMAGISDQNLSFARFKGKPTLVYYFSSQCPHCKQGYPDLENLARSFAPRGLNTVMVASGRNERADLRSFMQEVRVTLPVLQDQDYRFTRTYNVPTVPMAFLINAQGQFIRYANFHSDLNNLKAEIDKLLPKAQAKK